MGKSISQFLKNSLSLFTLFFKHTPAIMSGLVFLSTIRAVIPFANAYFWAKTFEEVIFQISSSQKNINLLVFYFLLSTLTNYLDQIFYRYYQLLEKKLFILSNHFLSTEIHQKIISLDLSFHEDSKNISILNKIKEGYDWKPSSFIYNILWTYNRLIQIVSATVILAKINPLFIIILLVSLIPEFINNLKNEDKAWGIWDAKADIKNRYYDTSYYLLSSNNYKEIKIFGIENKLISILRNSFLSFQNQELKLSQKNFYISLVTKSFEFLCFGAVELSLILKAIYNQITIAEYSFASQSMYKFSGAVSNLFGSLQSAYRQNLWVTDLVTLLNFKNPITYPNTPKLKPTQIPKIEFKNVSFKYPGTTRFIYKDLNLTINPGEDIAIVGENGAGKTTLIKLLCRFYDVTSGEILINNINLKNLYLPSWHAQLGILFQDFNKYAYTVKENIELGKNNAKITEAELTKHTKTAGAFDFISAYKNRFAQILSKSYDGGVEPSGGQWQRLALSRAFYRNANILILDEPTSAIDAKGEYEIFQKISHFQKTKTTIIISHRFSTVRKADTIYVIEKGKVIESGSHQELMQLKSGIYHQMFTLQAQGYKD